MYVHANKTNNYTPTFKTNIYVSNKMFDELPLIHLSRKQCSSYPWSIKNAVWSDEAYTTGASVCSVLRLKTKEFSQLFLTHLVPDRNENLKRTNVLLSVVEKLRTNSKSDVSAVLTGGNSDDVYSMEAGAELLNLLDNLDVKTTAMFGQPCSNYLHKLPVLDGFFSQRNDTAVLKITPSDRTLKFRQEIDLASYFEIFRKNPEDSFKF